MTIDEIKSFITFKEEPVPYNNSTKLTARFSVCAEITYGDPEQNGATRDELRERAKYQLQKLILNQISRLNETT
jgi:hypothetical protein